MTKQCDECGRLALPSGEIFHVDECPNAIIAPGTVGFPSDLRGNYLDASVRNDAALAIAQRKRARA